MADGTRLRILSLLAGRELCVCDLTAVLGLGQPKVSRHLAYLRRAGLVAARKEGLWRHYALAGPGDAFHRGLLSCLRGRFRDAPSLRRDRERLVKRVLFLCTGNSCRSQMAEALLNRLGRGRFQAFSAGAKPAGFVHPLALETLRAAGLSGRGLRSKPLEEFRGRRFEAVITVCDRAKEACPLWPGARMLHWGLEDPAEAKGSLAARKAAFRKAFRELEARLRRFIGARSCR